MRASVVICWKIRIFAYWTTPKTSPTRNTSGLWFAEKFVSLLIEQHLYVQHSKEYHVVICWKIRIFAYWTTPRSDIAPTAFQLWFAEKFVSLLIEQHLDMTGMIIITCCDLLKNSYLCLLNNTPSNSHMRETSVVICWKIRIFAYWTTPYIIYKREKGLLWFAEKFVSLLIEQHRVTMEWPTQVCCDLLKNSYLCLLNNTTIHFTYWATIVVICWKIRIFAYWTTPLFRTFPNFFPLWFAEKFVSLLIEQHLISLFRTFRTCCDLLKNSYLCLLNNTTPYLPHRYNLVVICWKIRIFAYWTTPVITCGVWLVLLWFAEKFVSLLIEQHLLEKIDWLRRVVICWKIRIFAYWTTPRFYHYP